MAKDSLSFPHLPGASSWQGGGRESAPQLRHSPTATNRPTGVLTEKQKYATNQGMLKLKMNDKSKGVYAALQVKIF